MVQVSAYANSFRLKKKNPDLCTLPHFFLLQQKKLVPVIKNRNLKNFKIKLTFNTRAPDLTLRKCSSILKIFLSAKWKAVSFFFQVSNIIRYTVVRYSRIQLKKLAKQKKTSFGFCMNFRGFLKWEKILQATWKISNWYAMWQQK
jgi:hypothetical protein